MGAAMGAGMGAAFGDDPGAAEVGGMMKGMGSFFQSSNGRDSLIAGVVSGDRASLKLNYQKPGKKATTILSPHLETIDEYGSMQIVLDNSSTSI